MGRDRRGTDCVVLDKLLLMSWGVVWSGGGELWRGEGVNQRRLAA